MRSHMISTCLGFSRDVLHKCSNHPHHPASKITRASHQKVGLQRGPSKMLAQGSDSTAMAPGWSVVMRRNWADQGNGPVFL